jgi:hypothetical protein
MTAGKLGGFGVTGVRPNRPTRCSDDLSNTPIAPAMKELVFTVWRRTPKDKGQLIYGALRWN